MSAIRSRTAALVAMALVASLTGEASAQSQYPNRPIRLLLPFAPGGGIDTVARVMGQKASQTLGQPILIESKPGAGGTIATNELLRSEADGYTLLITTSSHATLPALQKLTWHPSNDFTPIANVYSTMFVMPTNKATTSRFKTFKEFLTYVRANPGKVNWGSSGIAGPQHLAGTQFMKVAGLDMVHVPYRGNGPMLQGLLANEIQLTFDTPTLPFPHIQSGALTALAVTGDQRLPKLLDVPTVRESGVDYSANVWVFVLGPKGLPQPVQARLNRELAAALGSPEVRDRITGFGLTVPTPAENTPANLKKHIDDFATTYGKLIAELGLKAQ